MIKLNLKLKDFGNLNVMNIMRLQVIEDKSYEVIGFDTNLLLVERFIEEELKKGNIYIDKQILSSLRFELTEIGECLYDLNFKIDILNYLCNKNIIKELNISEVRNELLILKDVLKNI